jgi:hypothetical protein
VTVAASRAASSSLSPSGSRAWRVALPSAGVGGRRSVAVLGPAGPVAGTARVRVCRPWRHLTEPWPTTMSHSDCS